MATRSNIGIRVPDSWIGKKVLPNGYLVTKKYLQVYHHWDGYVSYLGRVIDKVYRDATVDEIYETFISKGHIHSTKDDGTVVSYSDAPIEIMQFDAPVNNEEYLYVLDLNKKGKWVWMAQGEMFRYQTLRSAIKKHLDD